MKKFKKVIAMGLATMAAVSAMSMTALAIDTDSIDSSIISTHLTGGIFSDGIEPANADKPWGDEMIELDTNKTTQYFDIDTTDDMPFLKIWVQNDSESRYYVTLHKGSENGPVKKSMYVAKKNATTGKSGTNYFKVDTSEWGTGTYYVCVNSQDSYWLNGYISAKIATTNGELN